MGTATTIKIGGRLRAIRQTKDLSVSDCAFFSAVSEEKIQQLETGKIENADFATLYNLSQYYKIPFRNLIFGNVARDQINNRHFVIVILDGICTTLKPMKAYIESVAKDINVLFFSTPLEILDFVRNNYTDLIVIDYSMPILSGAEFIEILQRTQNYDTPIVVNTTCPLQEGIKLFNFSPNVFLVEKPAAEERVVDLLETLLHMNIEFTIKLLPRSAKVLIETANLPSFSSVVMEVQAMIEDEADYEAIAVVLNKDLALTARVLQLANAGIYYTNRPIAHVLDAIGLIGMDNLNRLVIVAGMFGVFNKATDSHFDLRLFWEQSCYKAVAAQIISEGTRELKHVDVFTPAILSDIGRLVCYMAEPVLKQEVEQNQNIPEAMIEKRHLGFTADRVSVELLRCWRLPPPLIESIEEAIEATPSTEKIGLPQIIRQSQYLRDAYYRYPIDQDNIMAIDKKALTELQDKVYARFDLVKSFFTNVS